MTKKIGIFGGTFDPPHVGHQILAMEAYDQLNLDMVYWVLTAQPPHKTDKEITSTAIRIRMVQKAILRDEKFRFSKVDINRTGPHYIVDTMKIFRSKYSKETLCFIMGGDSLQELSNWHKSMEFIEECDKIGVMHRVGEKINLSEIESKLPGIKNKIEFIEAPLLEISSNQIRKLVRDRKPFRYYLPPKVYKIVLDERLYINN